MSFVGLDMLMGLDTPKLIVPTEFKVFDFSQNYFFKKKIYSVTSKNNYTSNKSTQWAQLPPSSKSYTKTYTDVSIGNVEIPNYDIAFVDHLCWCQNNMEIFCSIFISLCHYEVIMLYWKRKKVFEELKKENGYVYLLKFGNDSMETKAFSLICGTLTLYFVIFTYMFGPELAKIFGFYKL